MGLVGFNSFLALNQSLIVSAKLIILNNCSRKMLGMCKVELITCTFLVYDYKDAHYPALSI